MSAVPGSVAPSVRRMPTWRISSAITAFIVFQTRKPQSTTPRIEKTDMRRSERTEFLRTNGVLWIADRPCPCAMPRLSSARITSRRVFVRAAEFVQAEEQLIVALLTSPDLHICGGCVARGAILDRRVRLSRRLRKAADVRVDRLGRDISRSAIVSPIDRLEPLRGMSSTASPLPGQRPSRRVGRLMLMFVKSWMP